MCQFIAAFEHGSILKKPVIILGRQGRPRGMSRPEQPSSVRIVILADDLLNFSFGCHIHRLFWPARQAVEGAPSSNSLIGAVTIIPLRAQDLVRVACQNLVEKKMMHGMLASLIEKLGKHRRAGEEVQAFVDRSIEPTVGPLHGMPRAITKGP